jgi:ABC-2 type transport system permease protein
MTTTATPAPAVRPLRAPAALAVHLAFIGRSLRHTLRTPDVLVMAVALPVMLMLLFTFVFGGALEEDGRYVDYVVPGIVLLCAGFGAASVAVEVAQDMTTGIIDRFRTMPLDASAAVAGHVVVSLVRNLATTAVVVGVALALGFRPTAGPLAWLAVTGIVALYVLAITVVFAALGLAASSPEGAQGYGFVLLFLPYLSSAFVPVDTMPEWLQWVARNQPLTPIIEAIRSLLLGTPIGANGWLAIAWCTAVLVVAVPVTGVLFRRKAGRR